MNFTPTGLTLPDCACFREKAALMNRTLDETSAIFLLDIQDLATEMNICNEARDYFVSIFVWGLISFLIVQKKDDQGTISEYRKEFEEAYDRIKPLVMQRIDYADGVIMDNMK